MSGSAARNRPPVGPAGTVQAAPPVIVALRAAPAARPGVVLLRWLLQHRARPLAVRVVLALGLALVGFGARLAWGGMSEGHAVDTFVPVVVLATLALGVLPGLIATLISGLLATWGFVAPVGSLTINHLWDARVWVILAVTSMATAVALEVMWLMVGERED